MIPRPIHVLCVEDEPLQQQILKHHLQAISELACSIVFETTEEGAWTAFRKHAPDLVLVDYQLMEGNGLSLIRRLRQLDPYVSIIAVSGVAPTEVAEELVRSGADDYLDKRGLDSAALARTVRSALRRADAFRLRVPSMELERDALKVQVRELYVFLVGLQVDALLRHSDAVTAAARLVGGIDQVVAVFDHVCQESGNRPELARRVLQPYLLEVVARISPMPDPFPSR